MIWSSGMPSRRKACRGMPPEPVDGREAPLHRWIGMLTFDGAEACHKLASVALAKHWPPGLNRLRETGKTVARATMDRREIVSNGRCGQVQLCRCGLEMPFEAGHEIEDDAVDVENHQLQRMTKQLHRPPLSEPWHAVVVDRCESARLACKKARIRNLPRRTSRGVRNPPISCFETSGSHGRAATIAAHGGVSTVAQVSRIG